MNRLERIELELFETIKKELGETKEDFDDIWGIYKQYLTSGLYDSKDLKFFVAIIMNKIAIRDIERQKKIMQGLLYLGFEALTFAIETAVDAKNRK